MPKTLTEMFMGMNVIENEGIPEDCVMFVGPKADGTGFEVKAAILGGVQIYPRQALEVVPETDTPA